MLYCFVQFILYYQISIFDISANMDMGETLLGKNSQIKFKVVKNNSQVELKVDHASIWIGQQKISLSDAIGLVRKQSQPHGMHSYSVYSYPKLKKLLRKQKRYVMQYNFNVKDVIGWQEIKTLIINRIANRSQYQSKKLLICFNPNAGSNSAKHLNNILSFIRMTNLTPEVFNTEYRNHCLQHLQKIDKSKYCGVAIVSGDGLMHQYVNSFCGIPVTHVPAGSGNAFAKTQMQIAGQECKDQQSIFLVVKNRTKQFNIIKYDLQKLEKPIYSFLGFQWAIIADLDMNSEFLRCLGGLRFQVYAAWRCIVMKRYRGKITYSLKLNEFPSLDTAIQANPNEGTHIIDGTFLHTIFCSIPYISDKYKIAPLVNVDQRFLDIQVLNQQAGRSQLIKYLLSSDSGSHFNLQQKRPADGFNFINAKAKCFRLEPLNPNQMGIFGIDGQAYQSQKIQASFDERTFQAFV